MSQLQAFDFNIKLFKILGEWCYPNEFFYKIYKYLTTSLLFLNWFLTMIFVLTNFQNSEIVDSLYISPSVTTSILKYVIFRKNFKIVQNLLKIVESQFEFLESKKQKIIIKDALKFSNFVIKSCFYLVVLTVTALVFQPLLQDEIDVPLVIWLPFDYHKSGIFELIYVFVSVSYLFFAFINVATDCFFYIAAIQIGAQCEILEHTLKNLNGISENFKEVKNHFLDCIIYYNNVLKCTNIISDCYREILVVQFICSSIALCMTMYQLSIVEPFSDIFFKMCLFQSAVIYEIFLYCFFGDLIMKKSGKLFYAAFSFDWFETSAKFQKELLIFMTQLQKPVIFYVGNVIPVNCETFKTIMQKSWSFFIALKNTQNR